MKLLILAAVLLLVPAPTAAQEPIHLCTELVVPGGSPPPGLARGEPQDGRCDVILYLPMVLAEPELLGEQLAKELQRRQVQAHVDALACDELEAYYRLAEDPFEGLAARLGLNERCPGWEATPPPAAIDPDASALPDASPAA